MPQPGATQGIVSQHPGWHTIPPTDRLHTAHSHDTLQMIHHAGMHNLRKQRHRADFKWRFRSQATFSVGTGWVSVGMWAWRRGLTGALPNALLLKKTRILQKQLLAVFICVIYLCAFESIMYKLKASDGSFLSDAHIVESSILVCFVNLIYVRYMEACMWGAAWDWHQGR